MKDVLYQKLTDALKPDYLEIINESHLHQGHAGDDGSGESHYCINISSSEFKGLSRVEQHRLINTVLKEEFKKIHSIKINIKKA